MLVGVKLMVDTETIDLKKKLKQKLSMWLTVLISGRWVKVQ
jgi:hypothetical protein